MYNSQIIYDRIKDLLEQEDKSMGQLNQECNISGNTISQSATSKEGMKAKRLYDIASFLNCSLDYLFGRTDNKLSHKGEISVSANDISGNSNTVGVGNVVHNTGLLSEHQQLIDTFNSLDSINKAKLQQYLNLLSESQKEEAEKATNKNINRFASLDVKDLIKNGIRRIVVEQTLTCPRCNKRGIREIVSGLVYQNYYTDYLAVFFYCYDCNQWFVATYYKKAHNTNFTRDEYLEADIYKCEPCNKPNYDFGKYIEEFSPNFVEIYNQSLYAEILELNQISGMGFRKAVEFLVKDFAILNHPDEKDKILSTYLGDCINDYIDNDKIKTLSEKSTWLGNDETHYLKKRTDEEISHMKNFIIACAKYIELELIVKKAETIEKIGR